jgi:hypothetical protein
MPQETPRPSAALNVQSCPGGSETLAGTSDFQVSNHKSFLQQKFEAGPGIRIGQVRVRGHCADRFVDVIADIQLMALAIDGSRAFDCPKSSAAFHEAGHCLVSFLQGTTPSRASIWPIKELGRTQWIGRTYGLPKWSVNETTSPEADLQHAHSQLAGVASEALFDSDYRAGSSTDEITIAQGIVLTAAAKLLRDEQQLWLETLAFVAGLLKANAAIVFRIAEILQRSGSISRRPLQRILRKMGPVDAWR